jgi:hypothetical protein
MMLTFRCLTIFDMFLWEPKSLRRVGEFSAPMNIWVNLYSPSLALRFALNIFGANYTLCRDKGVKRGELKLRSLVAAEFVTLRLRSGGRAIN